MLSESALNKRAATPVTPTIPPPVSVSKEILFILDKPLTGFPFLLPSLQIKVPLVSGLKVFFIRTGIPFQSTGLIVGE